MALASSTAVSEPAASPASPAGTAGTRRALSGQAGRLGYGAVLAFYVLYFFRPEDFIPGLARIPFEKLVGGLAALALLGAVLSRRFRSGREVVLIVVFFIYLCFCIPGAIWQGGSFGLIVDGFAKYILVVLATIGMVDSLARCRRIMLIQTLAILLMAVLALGQAREWNRMYGVGSMFSDPNDFALYLCTILPLCVAFSVSARSRLRRLLWAGAACLAITAIISTYSRGGFLAMIATLIFLAIRFPGGVRKSVITAVVAGVIAAMALSGSHYMYRLDTIFHPDADKTGSAQARQALLIRSIEVTLEHPLLGVGPGNFEIVSGDWHVTHNSYTQLSAEAGIPALLLFLSLMWCGFRDLKTEPGRKRGELAALTAAVQCSFIGYLVGATFLSTSYWLEPYLLVAYAVILKRLGRDGGLSAAEAGAAIPRTQGLPPGSSLARTIAC